MEAKPSKLCHKCVPCFFSACPLPFAYAVKVSFFSPWLTVMFVDQLNFPKKVLLTFSLLCSELSCISFSIKQVLCIHDLAACVTFSGFLKGVVMMGSVGRFWTSKPLSSLKTVSSAEHTQSVLQVFHVMFSGNLP